jgi:hypothetical protein
MRARMHGIVAGGLVASLLLSGLLVGVSQGATGPATIRLTFGDVLVDHEYTLRDHTGERSGHIGFVKGRLSDVDGTEVGRHRSMCPSSANVGWWCTHTLVLHDGPYTDDGSITVTGLFHGFNGEAYAVVGGTGAYEGANGSATATVEDDGFVLTVDLS